VIAAGNHQLGPLQGYGDCTYLRIQDSSLSGATVDVATPENMRSLVAVGERMLTQQVSRVNVETGRYELVPGEGSNADALAGFAKQLSAERKTRLEHRNATISCICRSRHNSSSSKEDD
jgi:hypothetical protein